MIIKRLVCKVSIYMSLLVVINVCGHLPISGGCLLHALLYPTRVPNACCDLFCSWLPTSKRYQVHLTANSILLNGIPRSKSLSRETTKKCNSPFCKLIIYLTKGSQSCGSIRHQFLVIIIQLNNPAHMASYARIDERLIDSLVKIGSMLGALIGEGC